MGSCSPRNILQYSSEIRNHTSRAARLVMTSQKNHRPRAGRLVRLRFLPRNWNKHRPAPCSFSTCAQTSPCIFRTRLRRLIKHSEPHQSKLMKLHRPKVAWTSNTFCTDQPVQFPQTSLIYIPWWQKQAQTQSVLNSQRP